MGQLSPDGYHPQHRYDTGQHEDEAGEPLQGSLIDLSEGRDVHQAHELQR